MFELTAALFLLAAALFLAIVLVELALPKAKAGARKESVEERVQRLERMAESNGSYLHLHKLGKKLERLERFRMNAEVELKAIKEALEGIKGRKTRSRGESGLNAEEMHRLIYRSK